jgi:hypothetical protein
VLGLVLVGAFAALARNPDCVAFGEASIAPLSDPIDPAFVRAFQESTLARSVPKAFLDRVVSESLKVPARVWKAPGPNSRDGPHARPAPHCRSDAARLGRPGRVVLCAEQEVLVRSILLLVL